MEDMFYRGLNCHLACLINIASEFEINYTDAFCSLWSEKDFKFLDEYNIFVSKRATVNLNNLGICTQTAVQDSVAFKSFLYNAKIGEFFIVGMDIFYIIWQHVYNFFHGSHYFFIKKISEDFVFCYDPVYDKREIELKINYINSHAFELSRVYKCKALLKNSNTLIEEARAVVKNHPKILEKLSSQILSCKDGDTKKINFINRQITAMLNNRFLFSRYLNKNLKCNFNLFDNNFLSKWDALRNGLIKATIVKNKIPVLDEVNYLFTNIIKSELDFASKLLQNKNAFIN